MRWIELDYPPTANNLFRNAPGKGRVKTDQYKAWKTKAAWQIKTVVGADVIEGPYRLYLRATAPDRRRRDISNLVKPVEDALVMGCAVTDDHLCQYIEAKWSPGEPGVRVLVLPTAEAA